MKSSGTTIGKDCHRQQFHLSDILYPFAQKTDSDRNSTCDNKEEDEDENGQKPSISGDGVLVELSL